MSKKLKDIAQIWVEWDVDNVKKLLPVWIQHLQHLCSVSFDYPYEKEILLHLWMVDLLLIFPDSIESLTYRNQIFYEKIIWYGLRLAYKYGIWVLPGESVPNDQTRPLFCSEQVCFWMSLLLRVDVVKIESRYQRLEKIYILIVTVLIINLGRTEK